MELPVTSPKGPSATGRNVRASALSLAALTAFVLAFAPPAGAVIPIRGAYSGTTAAGAPISMVVTSKKTGPKLRPKIKRRAWAGHVRAAVPITCSSGLDRSEEVGFPGPLGINKQNGRFAVTGIAQSTINPADRVTTRVVGRFTGRRKASGILTYTGGFAGEFCSGEITWTATRE